MISIQIGGTDRTDLVEYTSLVIKFNMTTKPCTASFIVRKFGSRTYLPVVDDEVIITQGSDVVFGGHILEINEIYRKVDEVSYVVKCIDYTRHLDKKLISDTFEDVTVDSVISSLKDNFFPSDVSISSVDVTTPVGYIAFNYEYPSVALRQLADLANADWFIDANKSIHFFHKEAKIAPFSLTDTNGKYVYDSLKIRRDLSQLRNTIVVRGGEFLANTTTAAFEADGIRKDFYLPHKYSNLTLTVTGQEKSVGIDPIDEETNFDALHNFQEKFVRFREDKKPTAGSEVRIGGNPNLPVIIKMRDETSVETFSVREYIVVDKSIKSKEGARDRALAELIGYKTTIAEADFRTYQSNLRVGQKLKVKSDHRSLDEEFIINKIEAEVFGTKEDGTTQLVYTVSLISTRTFDYISFLQSLLLKTNKEIVVDDNEIVDLVRAVSEDITLSDVVSTLIDGDVSVAETIDLGETVTAQSLNYKTQFVLGLWTSGPEEGLKRQFILDGSRLFQGLLIHYKLNENVANTDVEDSAGTLPTGVASQNTSAMSTSGKINTAFTFNGSSDNINLGNGKTLSFGSEDFSVCAWIKLASLPSSGSSMIIIGKFNFAGSDMEWALNINSVGDYISLSTSSDGSTPLSIRATETAITTGVWTHVAMTKTGTTWIAYLNGSAIGSNVGSVASTLHRGSTITYIGSLADPSFYFDGDMDDVRVYNKVLSADEIANIYNSGVGTEDDV